MSTVWWVLSSPRRAAGALLCLAAGIAAGYFLYNLVT